MELLIYKICITGLAVLGLSFVAEKFSVKLAGLLAGYPIGTAIILHFYGLEYGADFAAEAAVFNLCGLLASQCFAFAYYRTSLRSESLFLTSIAALGAYFLPAAMVSQTVPTRLTALLVAVIATSLFCILLRGRKNVAVTTPKAWSVRLITGRLFFTTALVVLVTEIAEVVGPNWAGIFSAFPVALYPLVLLLHREYNSDTARTILGNFPYGLWSVIAYALTVSLAYPALGVWLGTLLGFAAATTTLLATSLRALMAHGRSLLRKNIQQRQY